jgi:hypothetical protein
MKSHRVQIAQFPVTKEGTCDLPAGAFIVALDFEDEGGMGAARRPATAWVAVPVENETTENDWVSPTAE